jgi:hypothetical protein
LIPVISITRIEFFFLFLTIELFGVGLSRSLYWKITVPFILLVVISMSVLGFFMVNSVRNAQLDNLQSYLANEARLIA